ncbi:MULTISPECIES: RadC family protein [Dyella]|uniref:JAB domain-containing protein n=2 Tax=Dyella TaxID=231454 RepID=A0A4R0YQG4_9GAMM|nr:MULTISPECIES: DNA repair protein RadC [Dyella]TBR35786.1 JAB domain-containing protein [Dyella terrae]TCI08666.1 JAB domain-containing protein [Dyella soli]
MSIRDWPEGQRPREKLIARGPSALSDAELMAVMLGSGVRGMDAIALGRELITQAGGLHALFAQPEALPRVTGLGPAKRARLIASLELARRSLAEQLTRGDPLTSPQASATFLRAQLRHLPYEVFACLFLDNRHRVLAFEEMFRGTVNSASVHPREVVRACLRHNACAVILAHNHPSGVAEPSAADRSITKELVQALGLVDVRVLDHFVIGSGDPVSMAERGWV